MLYALSFVLLCATVFGKLCKEDKECMTDHVYGDSMTTVMKLITEQRVECRLAGTCPNNQPTVTGAATACVNGYANGYPCSNIDMLSYINLADLGGSGNVNGNDIWGWLDTQTGRYYALAGKEDGMSIVDISDPINPFVVCWAPSEVSPATTWRDMKIYNDYVYVVADDRLNNHGMQAIDLTQVRDISNPSKNTYCDITSVYRQFGSCHNIVIPEDENNVGTGFAYAVGTRTCSGGLHVVNIKDPSNPTFEGCFSSDGYTHDSECVIYNGPDSQYVGKEICFNYNEDTLTIVDASDHTSPVMISRTGYANSAYTHQGWLTEDHEYILMDDELDEYYGTTNNGGRTRTHLINVQDLGNPIFDGYYDSTQVSIDHNLYIYGKYAYLSNYMAGLRVYDVSNVASQVSEVAYFDVYPEGDGLTFIGAWSAYAGWVDTTDLNGGGVIILQSIDRGLFVLQVDNLGILNETTHTPLKFHSTK